jgi:drug efflux transport system ATP-binding protein
MDEAEYCRRLALMYKGRIIALGTPQELKDRLHGQTLLRLDTGSPLDTMKALEGAPGVSDVAVFGSGLHLTVPDKSAIPQIRQRLESQGIEIRRLEPIPPSMEDVFVAMIEAEDRKVA